MTNIVTMSMSTTFILSSCIFLIVIICSVISTPKLIVKRCQDINKSGKIPSITYCIVAVVALINFLYSFYVSINMSFLDTLPTIHVTLSTLSLYLNIIGSTILVVLIFYPGTRGTNSYGEPNTTRVSLLG